jgi:D-alanine-D-alanine ligase
MPKTRCIPRDTAIMAKSQKTKLGIIFGGRSGEHEVSLTSAASVISALDPNEFQITAIGITKSGKLADGTEIRTMLPPAALSRVSLSPALEANCSGMKVISGSIQNLEEVPSDGPMIVFPLLHGPYGEDGTIQGLLEIAGIPYVGCGVLASAVGMDKDVMKRLFLQAGLPTPPFRTVFSRDLSQNLDSLESSVAQEFGYPIFSKPANLGSSVGISKIHSRREFEDGVRHSAQFDRKVVIEKGIDARELECAILGNDSPQASVVGEIISAHEFYDYGAKYENPGSRLEIPARLKEKKAEEIRELALRSFKAIDGSGMARVDFFLERGTDTVWINEINTIPGFTPISMYTKLWAATGVAFDELVKRLVQFGEERFHERNNYRTSL